MIASAQSPGVNGAAAIWRRSGAHIAFKLALAERNRVVDRAALLRALGDHLAHDALSVHLDPDLRRGRMAGNRHDDIAAWREIIKRTLGRSGFLPDVDIGHVGEGRDVETLARDDQLLDRGLAGEMSKQAFCRP